MVPMYVIVDELDRCRPSYAIKLLERAKHLFASAGVVFVIATDTNQLAKAVSGIYGAEFDGRRYLRRFFSRTVHLPAPPVDDYVSALVAADGLPLERMLFPSGKFEEWCADFYEALGFSLRDIERCHSLIVDFVTEWQSPAKILGPVLIAGAAAVVAGLDLEHDTLSGLRLAFFHQTKGLEQRQHTVSWHDSEGRKQLDKYTVLDWLSVFDPLGRGGLLTLLDDLDRRETSDGREAFLYTYVSEEMRARGIKSSGKDSLSLLVQYVPKFRSLASLDHGGVAAN